MKKINIAVWSIGEHAQRNILPALIRVPNINLTGMYTRNSSVLSSVSKQYACSKYTTYLELLEDPTVDAVYINSPNSEHFSQIKSCLLKNKHVIVEKIAVISLEEAQVIYDIATERRLIVMEAFMFGFHKQFLKLRELIQSNKYGEIREFHASFGFPELPETNIRYSKVLSGGALNDAGAYTVSSVIKLLGDKYKCNYSTLMSLPKYEVDSSGLAVFSSDESTAICSWVMGGSYKNMIEIWLETAHIVVDRAFSKHETHNSKINIYSNGDLLESIDTGCDNHFINMFEYFSNCIINKDYKFELENLLNHACLMATVRG
jgi:dTDP-3,4-didehydro-2,6-dideoxy-alpha-D-glucose 3-reductase